MTHPSHVRRAHGAVSCSSEKPNLDELANTCTKVQMNEKDYGLKRGRIVKFHFQQINAENTRYCWAVPYFPNIPLNSMLYYVNTWSNYCEKNFSGLYYGCSSDRYLCQLSVEKDRLPLFQKITKIFIQVALLNGVHLVDFA